MTYIPGSVLFVLEMLMGRAKKPQNVEEAIEQASHFAPSVADYFESNRKLYPEAVAAIREDRVLKSLVVRMALYNVIQDDLSDSIMELDLDSPSLLKDIAALKDGVRQWAFMEHMTEEYEKL
jgi:hypothetical protein